MGYQLMVSSAQVYLQHLARAAGKIAEREYARKKLALQLQALKKLSTPTLRKELARLEVTLKETLKAERQLLHRQEKEEELHVELSSKVHKITVALDKQGEKARLNERTLERIETTLVEHAAEKDAAVARLEDAMSRLEKAYPGELGKKKFLAERVQKIKEKIRMLKN